MKKLVEVVLIIALCFVGAVAQDQCDKCKCTEYPVPEKCTKCCGVIKGTVTASSQSHVKVTAAQESRDLQITDKTVINGDFSEGATVTVVYNKETNVAGLIQGR